MSVYQQIVAELKHKASTEKAAFFPRFFKTGKGQYGEGDLFYGITVPHQRSIAKKYQDAADANTLVSLLDAAYHEERLTAIFILLHKFKIAKKTHDERYWVDLYLQKIDRINNWDLVDSSAPYLLGVWLEDKDRSILYAFAQDPSLWKNRIAVLSTFHFIKKNDLRDLLQLSEQLLSHPHDLMHKAIGWMLREAWKRDPQRIENFIEKHIAKMPRTLLRYAIEKMETTKRLAYLKK